MRLKITKSKNAQSLYVIRSTYENGKHSSKIVEKLGTYAELSKIHNDPIAWAKQYIRQLNDKEKVLEIGTGSGYQTAVLVAMNAWVYTVERQKDLHDFAHKKLRELHLRPKFQSFGDGFAGLPTFAPFDKILVTCGAEILPTELLHQLKVGGKMVIP